MKKTTYICDLTKKENLEKHEVINLKLFQTSKLNPDIHVNEDVKYDEQYEEYDLSLEGAEMLISYIIKQLHGYDEKMYAEISSYLRKSKKATKVKFEPIHGEKKD